MTEQPGQVYLLYEENWAVYKIGFTTQSITDRLHQLNKKYNAEFLVYGSIPTDEPKELERLFHAIFNTSRVTEQREWFYLTDEQVSFFDAIHNVGATGFYKGQEIGNEVKEAYEYVRGYDAGINAGYEQALANEEKELTYWREYEEKKAREYG
jgi:hypothetical protein